MKFENFVLKKTLDDLEAKMESLECPSRRNNLIFVGINEEDDQKTSQQCEEKLKGILEKASLLELDFERVHRMGVKVEGKNKPRQVIPKFSNFKERDKVWQSRFEISRSCKIWIEGDFPEGIKSRRQKLLPALKAAQRSTEVKHATLRLDKLIVDGRVYTVETMKSLPIFLQHDKTAVVESEESVVFFNTSCIV